MREKREGLKRSVLSRRVRCIPVSLCQLELHSPHSPVSGYLVSLTFYVLETLIQRDPSHAPVLPPPCRVEMLQVTLEVGYLSFELYRSVIFRVDRENGIQG